MSFPFPAYAQTLVGQALAVGAAHAVPFSLADVPFDSRTLLKCMFGCDDWGKGLTCPSRQNNVSIAEYRQMLEQYKWGVLVHGHDKHVTQKASFAMEQAAFKEGYYFAFSFSDCGLCKTCAGHKKEDADCVHMKQARPALHSVGIDVFAMARRFGLPIDTLKRNSPDEQQNWYAAVFVE